MSRLRLADWRLGDVWFYDGELFVNNTKSDNWSCNGKRLPTWNSREGTRLGEREIERGNGLISFVAHLFLSPPLSLCPTVASGFAAENVSSLTSWMHFFFSHFPQGLFPFSVILLVPFFSFLLYLRTSLCLFFSTPAVTMKSIAQPTAASTATHLPLQGADGVKRILLGSDTYNCC